MRRPSRPQSNRRILRRAVRIRIPVEPEYCDACMEAFQAQVDNERPGHLWAICDGRVVYMEDVVAERHLGRNLSEDEVVVHRNGNPLDNRFGNLEVVNLEGLL